MIMYTFYIDVIGLFVFRFCVYFIHIMYLVGLVVLYYDYVYFTYRSSWLSLFTIMMYILCRCPTLLVGCTMCFVYSISTFTWFSLCVQWLFIRCIYIEFAWMCLFTVSIYPLYKDVFCLVVVYHDYSYCTLIFSWFICLLYNLCL